MFIYSNFFVEQTYIIFLAKLKRPNFSPGPESSECQLFALEDIPFDSLSFSSMLVTLKLVALYFKCWANNLQVRLDERISNKLFKLIASVSDTFGFGELQILSLRSKLLLQLIWWIPNLSRLEQFETSFSKSKVKYKSFNPNATLVHIIFLNWLESGFCIVVVVYWR